MTKDAQGPGPGAVIFPLTLLKEVLEEVKILLHKLIKPYPDDIGICAVCTVAELRSPVTRSAPEGYDMLLVGRRIEPLAGSFHQLSAGETGVPRLMEQTLQADVVVVGGGPGGYAAAFRAADLGLSAILVDSRESLGGACLHVGCIPSKAFLFVSELLGETKSAKDLGIRFSDPEIDINVLRQWKQRVVERFAGGLSQLAERRGVQFVRGHARFQNSGSIRLEDSSVSHIDFKHAIVATGSRPASLPGITLDDVHLMDSTGALELREIPQRLLVVGGGYIGLELGTVYAALGSQVTVAELTNGLLPGVDRDLVRPLEKRIRKLFADVYLNVHVAAVKEIGSGIEVEFEGKIEEKRQTFDRLLVSVGRQPNSNTLCLENTSVELDEKGFIRVDFQRRSTDERIFAIGDVAGEPMLAHKASREGKVAAEVISGQSAAFDNLAVPAVVFTDPEVAWCGLTETQAQTQQLQVKVTRFPWAASGRAATLGRSEGLTKILFEPETGQVLGFGIVGVHAGELIAEGVLALEMGAVAEDLAATIHTHPTLSETIGEAAEVFLGQATHIYR